MIYSKEMTILFHVLKELDNVEVDDVVVEAMFDAMNRIAANEESRVGVDLPDDVSWYDILHEKYCDEDKDELYNELTFDVLEQLGE